MPTIDQRLVSAVQHHGAGRLAEAEALYRGVLHEAPHHPHALHLFGVLAHQRGRHDEALGLIRSAIAVHGAHPVFYSNLAAVYLALGQLDETIRFAREALRLQPDLADAHNNLGAALMRQGQFDQAGVALAEAVRLNPRHLDARCNLAAVLHRQGRLPEAITLLQATVDLAPGHAQAQNDLGAALLAQGNPAQAEAHLRQAVRLRPAFAEAHSNLGVALREQGRMDQAVQALRKAVRLNPGFAGVHNNLGYTYEFLGRIDEARDEFLAALWLDPDNPRALAGLSGLATAGHYEFSADELRRIERLVTRTDLSLDDRGRLHFALARVRDRAGEPDEAFAHYVHGNALRQEYLRRRGAAYDPAAQRRRVDRLIEAFSPAYFARVTSFGVDSELPVFIVGMPRSGTSLAEQILASHPQVYGAGELQDLERLAQSLPRRLRTEEEYPECVARLDAATARAVAEEYLEALRRRGGEAARVVDKLPANFHHLGLIATLFPRARVIHCRRDPRDTCVSCFVQDFREPHPFALDLEHLGHYYREYERLMSHWKRVLPVPVFELDYEELTADQEGVSRRLVAFCGLEWDERCLRFHETDRPVQTASALQVRKPMYRSAVGRWKRYERHLGPLLAALRGEVPTSESPR